MNKAVSRYHARRNGGEYLQYRMLYALCFMLFLGVVLTGRLLPMSWRRRGPRRSVLGETRMRTDATVPMVFVGY